MVDLQDIPANAEKKTEERLKAKGFISKRFFERLFLESNSIMTYLSGAATVAVLFYWYYLKISWPLTTWVIFYTLFSIFRVLYWRHEVKKADAELKKVDAELKQLNWEIKQGSKFFEEKRKRAGLK